jgi:hypothetical protein
MSETCSSFFIPHLKTPTEKCIVQIKMRGTMFAFYTDLGVIDEHGFGYNRVDKMLQVAI